MPERGSTTSRDPATTLLLAWLLPGAGHWYAGRHGRGALYGCSVIAIFAVGLAMGGLATVSVTGHKWAFLLQVFDGPIAIAAAVASYLIESKVDPSQLADLGMTFTLVSAALNVLVLADAFYLADKPENETA